MKSRQLSKGICNNDKNRRLRRFERLPFCQNTRVASMRMNLSAKSIRVWASGIADCGCLDYSGFDTRFQPSTSQTSPNRISLKLPARIMSAVRSALHAMRIRASTSRTRPWVKHSRIPETTRRNLVVRRVTARARTHLEAGGGKETIPVRFTKDSPNTAAEKNEACLSCHQKGQPGVLGRQSTRDASHGLRRLPYRTW